MRCCLSTPGSPEYILCVAHSTSVTPVSLYTNRRSVSIYLEAVINCVWRSPGGPRSSEVGDALGCRDRASSEVNLEAEME